jgi:hypothetical protein
VSLSAGGKGRCENAFFVEEDVFDDATNWVYHNASAYIVTGEDEPVIMLGDLTVGDQATAWPEGSYDGTTGTRGYPPWWKDADGLLTTDWPSGLFYAGDASLVTSTLHEASFTRMFAYGFELDPDRIDYSQLGVPYNMLHADVSADSIVDAVQDGGFFYCMRGDGDRVVGVRQIGDITVVFKRHKTCLYQGVIGVNFGLASVLPVGAVSDEGIVIAGNDILFWSDDGPRMLSGVIKYGSINQFGISDDIRESVQAVSVDSLPFIHGRFERASNRVIWHVGIDDGSSVDQCFVYYLPEVDDPVGRWSAWDGLYCELSAVTQVTPESAPQALAYGLGNDGSFFLLNVGSMDAEFVINAEYITRWMDLSVLSIDKRLLSLIVVYGDEGRGDSAIGYATDYAEGFSKVGHELQTFGGGDAVDGIWDAAVWDDPTFLWDITGRGITKYGLVGLGFIVRFKVADSSAYGFSVSGMALDVSFKGKV